MPIEIYLDGSGHHNGSNVMRLASVIASDKSWQSINDHWGQVLQQNGFKSLHMKDLMHGSSRNKLGKSVAESFALIKSCTDLLLAYKDSIKAFVCEVDLEEYAKAVQELQSSKPPESFCVDFCVGLLEPDDVGRKRTINLYFDRDERYLHKVNQVFLSHKHEAQGWPSQISKILQGSSKELQPIQIADMILGLRHYGGDWPSLENHFVSLQTLGIVSLGSFVTKAKIYSRL